MQSSHRRTRGRHFASKSSGAAPSPQSAAEHFGAIHSSSPPASGDQRAEPASGLAMALAHKPSSRSDNPGAGARDIM